MGGAAPVETGKKGKKSVDAEINLVPFIDLLSCLITFLLITAVWTQVSTLRVSQTGGLSTSSDSEQKEGTIDVRLTLTDRGYILSLAGQPLEMPKVEGGLAPEGAAIGFDAKGLGEKLKELKNRFPEQRAVTVAAEDGIIYEDLIGTIDLIVSNELPDVSVTAAVN